MLIDVIEKPRMMFQLEENFIVYAFRYALGRSTYAVQDVSECIIKNGIFLAPHTRNLIIKEIKEYYERIGQDGIYMQCDKDCWYNVVRELERINERFENQELA